MTKNESQIIERCLQSILAIADLVIITDTGSTDDTVLKAGLFLQSHNIKFKIYTRDFVNFGHNRTELLKLARQEDVDYVFMIDSDEALIFPETFDPQVFKNGLNKDYYDIKMVAGEITYYLPRLTCNRMDFKYVGVTHEYLNCSGFSGTQPDIAIHQINDSSRRVTNQKFADDARLLEKALRQEKDEHLKIRYTFYLAQTYHNMGNLKKAIKYYVKRSLLGGWKDEVFYSLYQLGNIYQQMNSVECVDYYIRAFEAMPSRVESLSALRDYYLKKAQLNFASTIQEKICRIPKPISGLFIEEAKYDKSCPFSITFP